MLNITNHAILLTVELCKAVLDNDFDRVRKAFLCNKVYDVEQPDPAGTTLLMAAARFGSYYQVC